MTIELIAQDSETGKFIDLSPLVQQSSLELQLVDQPGKFSFNYIDDPAISISEGSSLSFKVDGVPMFFGYVFKRSWKSTELVSVTAYDQMRYLKNKDTYVIKGKTASEVFTQICTDFKLRHKVVDASTYVLASRAHDGKTLFEVIQYGIDQTLINKAEWYLIRDNFGTLEFVNLNSLKLPLYIGDESLALDYTYEISIDGDTYTKVKLVRDNTETDKRDVWITQDSETIAKWGTLQYFEKVSEDMNEAQIKERADIILSLKNRATVSLKLECLGDTRVVAGSGVILGFSGLADNGIPKDKYYLVTSVTHQFTNDAHIMQLEVKVTS